MQTNIITYFTAAAILCHQVNKFNFEMYKADQKATIPIQSFFLLRHVYPAHYHWYAALLKTISGNRRNDKAIALLRTIAQLIN